MNKTIDLTFQANAFGSAHYRAAFRTLLIAGLIYALPVILVERYYVDDLGRALFGYTGWSSGGRPLADALFALVSFGTPIADISPLPQLLAVACLSAAGAALAVALFPGRSGWAECAVVFPIIGSPFFLENLAYKFDALTMSFATMLAVFAALPLRNRKLDIAVGSTIVICVLALYQPAINLFVALTPLLWIASSRSVSGFEVRFDHSHAFTNLAKFSVGAFVYLGFIAPATIDSEYGRINSATIDLTREGVTIFWGNLHHAYAFIHEYGASLPAWIATILGLAAACLIVERFLWSLRGTSISAKTVRTGLLLANLLVLLLSPFGILLVLEQPLMFPRTFIGFAGLMIFALYAVHALTERFRPLRFFLLAPLIFMFICAFIFSAAMRAQERYDQVFVGNLIRDLRAAGLGPQGILVVDGRQPRAPLVESAIRKWRPADRLVPIYLYNQWIWGYVLLRHYGLEFTDPADELTRDLAKTCDWPVVGATPQYRIRRHADTFTVSMSGAQCH